MFKIKILDLILWIVFLILGGPLLLKCIFAGNEFVIIVVLMIIAGYIFSKANGWTGEFCVMIFFIVLIFASLAQGLMVLSDIPQMIATICTAFVNLSKIWRCLTIIVIGLSILFLFALVIMGNDEKEKTGEELPTR